MVVDIPDVVKYANFGDHRLRGFWVAGGQISSSPIDFHRRPYNTLALPCERVILTCNYYWTKGLLSAVYPIITNTVCDLFVQDKIPIMLCIQFAQRHPSLLWTSYFSPRYTNQNMTTFRSTAPTASRQYLNSQIIDTRVWYHTMRDDMLIYAQKLI